MILPEGWEWRTTLMVEPPAGSCSLIWSAGGALVIQVIDVFPYVFKLLMLGVHQKLVQPFLGTSYVRATFRGESIP